MEILLSIILIVGGLAAIFYFRPKTQNNITEIKFMQTKTISDLKNMFSQMGSNGLENEYREFVELKGKVSSKNQVEAPFSNRNVAYCNSKLLQVTETKEEYIDRDGNRRTRVEKHENIISDEKSSQNIELTDLSSDEAVVLEINGTGCKLDIPKTLDRFEPKNNLGNYRFFNSFSWNRFGAETLGFRMTEETIDLNQSLYVIGEAYKVGNEIHIGRPKDKKKPFIVTTKSEEELVDTSAKNAMYLLVGGIVSTIIGIIMIASVFTR